MPFAFPSLICRALGGIAVLGLGLAAAEAGEADVVAAKVHKFGPGVYRFDVTVRHADTGWQHYADRWQVLGADGALPPGPVQDSLSA